MSMGACRMQNNTSYKMFTYSHIIIVIQMLKQIQCTVYCISKTKTVQGQTWSLYASLT